jgi:uncharacterized membrane protein YhaH (DUF805 family)
MKNIYKSIKQYCNFSGQASDAEFYGFLIFFFALNSFFFVFPKGGVQPSQWFAWTLASYGWLLMILISMPPLLAITTRRINTLDLKWLAKSICIIAVLCGALTGLIVPIGYCSAHYYSAANAMIFLTSIQAFFFSLTSLITHRASVQKQEKSFSLYPAIICFVLLLMFATILLNSTSIVSGLIILIVVLAIIEPAYRKRKLSRNQMISGLFSAIIITAVIICAVPVFIIFVILSSGSGHYYH